jgi:hypothetical protein
MAGRKLSAKTEEEVVFMENLLAQCKHLTKLTEEYAAAKKGLDQYLQPITRTLGQIRQRAMIMNLGPLADAAGILQVAAGRGSQIQRARVLREGIVGFEQNIERTMKAAIEADHRQRHDDETKRAEAKAAAAPWETPPKPAT